MAQEPKLDYVAILIESTPETTPPDVSPWIRYVAILTDGEAYVSDFEGTGADALRIISDTAEVTHLVAAGTVPGVTVVQAAARNGPGTGRLLTNATGNGLQWRAPTSSTYGQEVLTASDDTYLLHDGEDVDKFVRVQVWESHLEVNAWSEVELRDVFGNAVGHDDVTAGEASAGDVTSYSVTVHNASASGITGVKCWLDAPFTGIEISDDNVTWVEPLFEGSALALSDLAAGASDTLYIRRTISAGAASDDEVLALLCFSFDGL